MSLSTVQFRLNELSFFKDEIISLSQLPEHKIRAIYLYGSRVYGTDHPGSDYDFMVVACSLDREKEIRDSKYNLHIVTPDKFRDDLWNYRAVNLECIYAPSFAVVQESEKFKEVFKIDKGKLKKAFLSQSHDAWHKGKIKLLEMDIERGLKSIFHSLRILIFGIQMVEHGEIIDFSEANDYWAEIDGCDQFKWNYWKDNFLQRKRDLEKDLLDAEPSV